MPPRTVPYGILIALLIVALTYGATLTWGLPCEWAPTADSPAPLGPLAFLGAWTRADIAQKYPALHLLLTDLAYAPILVFWKLTGAWGTPSGVHPYGFDDPLQRLTVLNVVSNLMSLVMGLGVLFLGYRIAARDTPRYAWFPPLLLACSGVFTFYATTSNLDIPYLFWWALALERLDQYLRQPRDTLLVHAAIAAAASVATKDQAAGLVLGVVFFLLPAKSALRFAGTCALAYFVFAVLPQPWRWWEHVYFWRLGGPAIEPFVQVPATPLGYLLLLTDAATALFNVVSFIGLMLGLIALRTYANEPLPRLLVVTSLTYLAFILIPTRFVYDRFLLPVGFAVVLIAPRVLALLDTRMRLQQVIIPLVLLWHGATGLIPTILCKLDDQKAALDRTLDSYVPPQQPIELRIPHLTWMPNGVTLARHRWTLPPGAPLPDPLLTRYLTNEPARFLLTDHPDPTFGPPVHAWKQRFSWTPQARIPVLREFFLYELSPRRPAL